MKQLDLEYLCTVIGNLSGIPIRIYEQGRQTFFHSIARLPVDPMAPDRAGILHGGEHLRYFSTEHFFCYGIVRAGDTQIVAGPTRQIPATEQELREMAFRADVPADDVEDFMAGMRAIVPMPLESVMQMLCALNYMLNGEKKTLGDIAILDAAQRRLADLSETQRAEAAFADGAAFAGQALHNTYDVEQTMMSMIRRGDTQALTEWIAGAPAVRGGVLAPDQLRQRKNLFIVTATLASRAAIRGGMDVDDAFTLSDACIQQCELLTTPEQITNLQCHMVLTFARRVERLRRGRQPSQLTLDVANYIQHHMSEPVSVEAMARALYVSRSSLSRRFRTESGETLTDFILKEKTEEAKRLLRYTDKSLAAIGLYLGFSSQSHFARVFRKYAAMTPGEYRHKHAR